MIEQKPLKGLSKNVVVTAFPQEFPKESVDISKES
jgi:hypothetical protein